MSVLTGEAVGGLRGVEVGHKAEKVALDGERGAEHGGVDGCGEPITCVPGLEESFGPLPEQLEDLRSVQEAVPAVENEFLLGVAPARERVRPCSASVEVEKLRASVDHRAIAVSGSER
jgi:hypothetical protein